MIPTSRVKFFIGVVVALGIIAIISTIITACSSGTPAYVSQLKSDGYPVQYQSTFTGGEGVGEAYGCNGEYGELVAQLKSTLDAQSFAAQMNNGGGLTATVQGDLVSLQGLCAQVESAGEAA